MGLNGINVPAATKAETVAETVSRVNDNTVSDIIDDDEDETVPEKKGERTFVVNYTRLNKTTGESVPASFDLTLTTAKIGGLKHSGSAVSQLAIYLSAAAGFGSPKKWEDKATRLLPAVIR
jgi:hypothetical protein